MAKPRLEKVRALFYVLQHIQEGASNFDTPSGCYIAANDLTHSGYIGLIMDSMKAISSSPASECPPPLPHSHSVQYQETL